MKKVFLPVVVILVLLTASCKSSSFESDVRKMANYRCSLQKLMDKDQSDEKVKKEMEELEKEMMAFSAKMAKKWERKKNDKEYEKKADDIMDEVMEQCK